MKVALYIVLIVTFILVSFFGMGPVLLADGSTIERMLTLAVVLVIYIGLFLIYRWIRKRYMK